MGGFAHGRALGNAWNMADANDIALNDLGPVVGKVYLYFSNDDPGQFNLASMKPTGTIKCPVTPTVGPVLKVIARKFSPVRGKCPNKLYYIIND